MQTRNPHYLFLIFCVLILDSHYTLGATLALKGPDCYYCFFSSAELHTPHIFTPGTLYPQAFLIYTLIFWQIYVAYISLTQYNICSSTKAPVC